MHLLCCIHFWFCCCDTVRCCYQGSIYRCRANFWWWDHRASGIRIQGTRFSQNLHLRNGSYLSRHDRSQYDSLFWKWGTHQVSEKTDFLCTYGIFVLEYPWCYLYCISPEWEVRMKPWYHSQLLKYNRMITYLGYLLTWFCNRWYNLIPPSIYILNCSPHVHLVTLSYDCISRGWRSEKTREKPYHIWYSRTSFSRIYRGMVNYYLQCWFCDRKRI